MHEKTGRDSIVNAILDHPENKGRDKDELHALRRKLVAMTWKELQAEYYKL
jgi:hypothetical protein